MNSRTARKAVIGLLAAAALTSASPAFAIHATYTGVGGAYTTYRDGFTKAHVYDNSCNSRDVQAQYKRVNSGTLNKTNTSGGCGNSATSSGGAQINAIRVCSVVPVFDDTCSGWLYGIK
ncbi:MAG: hypothetical protein ACRC0L_04560 [Angustibacter sp.]